MDRDWPEGLVLWPVPAVPPPWGDKEAAQPQLAATAPNKNTLSKDMSKLAENMPKNHIIGYIE
jgi:hypothetical protein